MRSHALHSLNCTHPSMQLRSSAGPSSVPDLSHGSAHSRKTSEPAEQLVPTARQLAPGCRCCSGWQHKHGSSPGWHAASASYQALAAAGPTPGRRMAWCSTHAAQFALEGGLSTSSNEPPEIVPGAGLVPGLGRGSSHAGQAREVVARHAALRVQPDLPLAGLQHLPRPAQQPCESGASRCSVCQMLFRD